MNNTHWNGLRLDGTPLISWRPSISHFIQRCDNDATNYLTELPQVGATEVWEIINLTADAHPIHIHEFQFQLLNRQAFTMQGNKGYLAAYNAAFPGVAYHSGLWPALWPTIHSAAAPNETFTRAGGTLTVPIIGGNPNVDPFPERHGSSRRRAYEAGWKDTFIMNPGEVTRVVVRWTPQSIPVGAETPGTSRSASTRPNSATRQ